MRLGTSHKDRHSDNRAHTKIRFTNLTWNSLVHAKAHKRSHYVYKNTPRTNAHQLACHHHHSRCTHQTPTQAQTTNPTSHLHQQSFYIHCIPLWNALTEEAVTASTAEVFQRAAIPVVDIIVDCFSVNHELPAFLFNVLIILLIYLL